MNDFVKVIIPYFRSLCAYIEPTHQNFLTVDSFAYFDPDHMISNRYEYSHARLIIQKVVFNEGVSARYSKKTLIKLANSWSHRYEYYLGNFFHLEQITFYLRRV